MCLPFRSLGGHLSWRGRGLKQLRICNNSGHCSLSMSLWSETPTAIRIQIPDVWRTGSFLSSLDGFYKLCVGCSKDRYTAACHRNWGIDSCCCAKSWNWQKFIQAFFWKLQALNRLQNFQIVTSDRFCWCNCCLGRRQIPGIILPSFQNLLCV